MNGERSLSGTVHGNLEIEKGWGVRFEDEYYKVIYAKPKSLGKINIVQFDAVHQFFWDFDKTSVYSELDGSYPFQTFLDHIFNGSGYRYNLEVEVGSLRKQNFGLKKRLELFNDLVKHAGVEFQVRGKVVRILERTGTDLSTVVRKKLNLNDLSIEKRIGDFITYQKGLGAWHDENDHSKGRLEVEYVSPLAAIYGRLEGEPYVDERFTIAENFLAVLKKSVENSYSISVQLAMEDLQKAGYRYTRPLAGDYITVIDEDINFKERVRIVSFETKYDIKGQVIDHAITCNDIGSVKKQSVGYSSLKSSVANVSKETESAIQTANRALVSADGKSTVYFGTEFPQDVPKGTLTKGDTLYLTVGDTTKMYYWNGAEWLEPPVINDVEAFKESINAEIAQVNTTMQAQSEEHDRQVADILSKTHSVESLANQAKTDAASALARANQVKTEAIADARAQVATVSQALNTAKTDLQNIATYQETVDRKLTELTSNTRTLDGKIDAASAKVDTVAGQIRTELTRVEGKIPSDLGGRNYILKSDVYATSGSRYFDTSPEFIDYAYSGKYVTISLDIKGENLVPDSRGLSRIGCEIRLNLSDGKVLYLQCQKIVSGTQPRERISVTKQIPQGVSVVSANRVNMYIQVGGTALAGRPKFELSSIPSDWSPAPEDINSELSSTKTLITQTAEGQTQLSNRLTTTQDKVSTAETKINQLIGDVSSKVSQTDYNTLTGRVSSAETAITQNAQEISKRLTSTQVDKAITDKGYQTKSDVDSNITGRGYITSSALQPYALATTVQNLVRETADSFSRTISETKAMIPTEAGGRNYILGSRTVSVLSNDTQACPISTEQLKDGSREFIRIRRSNPSLNPSLISLYTKIGGFSSEMPTSGKGKISFKARASSPVNMNVMGILISSTSNNLPWNKSQISIGPEWKTYSFDFEFIKGMTILRANPFQILPPVPNLAEFYLDLCEWQLEAGTMASSWSPAPEDLATVTALHNVTDTVDSHTRTIGAVGETGSILDNVSKVTQTAAGLVQEVSGTNGLKTQVSTLAGSYAIKNLTSSGNVLNQLNLNKDGSVKIDGSLVQITGKTYIEDGVIKEAMIGKGQIGTAHIGEIDAGIAKIINLDVSKIKGLDAEFIKAKIENALIGWLRGKTISAVNNVTTFDLTTGLITVNNNQSGFLFKDGNSVVGRIGYGNITRLGTGLSKGIDIYTNKNHSLALGYEMTNGMYSTAIQVDGGSGEVRIASPIYLSDKIYPLATKSYGYLRLDPFGNSGLKLTRNSGNGIAFDDTDVYIIVNGNTYSFKQWIINRR
ncbi:phage tail protein [Streptococcus iners]|uniref:phage tail protein n=1 Tax=Streptococcus iners TaxID=3028084 RepID=UPI0020063449